MTQHRVSPFNYRYIPGVSQYSGGVMAEPGYELVRVRFLSTPALVKAFELVESYIAGVALTPQAVCAFELRSPGQFTEDTFREFNAIYNGRLNDWGVLGEDNPIARSNVIPDSSDLTEPSVHAFTYVRPAKDESRTTFVIAGSAEAPEGKGDYADNAIAYGDTSPEGMAQKADWVIGEMTRRLGVFGQDWSTVTDAQVYTKLPYDDAQARLAASLPTMANITWHYCNPPVEGLVYEMDCRRIFAEEVLDA